LKCTGRVLGRARTTPTKLERASAQAAPRRVWQIAAPAPPGESPRPPWGENSHPGPGPLGGPELRAYPRGRGSCGGTFSCHSDPKATAKAAGRPLAEQWHCPIDRILADAPRRPSARRSTDHRSRRASGQELGGRLGPGSGTVLLESAGRPATTTKTKTKTKS
jgi:hypothetical protein